MRVAHVAVLVASLVVLPERARADAQGESTSGADASEPDAAARAREDFREGLALMAAGDYAGALAKFNEVAAYKQTAQVMFNIAECEERLGKLVRALGDYRLALGKARDGSAPQVAELAPARIAALEPRIARLSIERVEPTPNPAARIEIDGVELGRSQGGAPLPVDPGERVVRLIVDGRELRRERIRLGEGETSSIRIEVPPPTDRVANAGGPSGPDVAAISLVVGGGLSVAVGAVFLGLRQGAIGELDELCGGDTSCPPSAEPTADRGRTFTGVAQITMPVGVVAAAVGIVMLATANDAPAPDVASAWPIVASGAPGADGPAMSLTWVY